MNEKKILNLQNLEDRLFALQDSSYRDFQSRIIPNIEKDSIIGIRIPRLRKLTKEFEKSPIRKTFLTSLPHLYYEENIMHAWLVASMEEYETCIQEVEIFLPYIDNWSVCDTFTPTVFQNHLNAVEQNIRRWLTMKHPYTVRFAIEMLMKFFLEESFDLKYFEWVAQVAHKDYYVKMMVAWYFATALAKRYEQAVPYLEQNKLERWTHNKTIQKAMESFRVTYEHKKYLKTLKSKKAR